MEDQTKQRAVAIHVTGRVQGVGFRAWARDTALDLDLRGWVRNNVDGSVSGVVAGPAVGVAEMLDALRAGPDHGQVASVAVTDGAEDPGPGFRIVR